MLSLNHLDLLIDQAKKALAKGDDKLVQKLLSSMEKTNENMKSKKKDEINPIKNYKKGEPSRTGLKGFTKYWDTHLKKLDIHLPLTIFNEEWIELDTMVAINNNSKKKDKLTGQIPKNEWWLSFAKWTRARQLMVKYIKQQYKHVDFGNE